jgi:hypothetical protein
VARVAGLPLSHPWRLQAYRDNGREFGARILRRFSSRTAFLTPPAVFRAAR